MSRPTSTRLVASIADCQACSFHVETPNALGLAAQHHDRTGHPITTTTEQAVTYGTEADRTNALEQAGQASLLDR